MSVSHKLLNLHCLQSIFWEERESLPIDRIDSHLRLMADHMGEIDRSAVHQNQINFGMRNATRLDDVLDGSSFLEPAFEVAFCAQEKSQIAMKGEPDRKRAHVIELPWHPNTRIRMLSRAVAP